MNNYLFLLKAESLILTSLRGPAGIIISKIHKMYKMNIEGKG